MGRNDRQMDHELLAVAIQTSTQPSTRGSGSSRRPQRGIVDDEGGNDEDEDCEEEAEDFGGESQSDCEDPVETARGSQSQSAKRDSSQKKSKRGSSAVLTQLAQLKAEIELLK